MALNLQKRIDGLRQLFLGVERRRVPPTQTVGAAGTAIYGGFVQSKERDPRLTGQKLYETYGDILANTSIVAAGVRHFLNLVAKAKWDLEPAQTENAEDQKRADELAELTWEALSEMLTPWHRVVRRAAMYRMYGFSVQEWTARRRDDGVIVYQDIAPRAQKTIERWDTDYHGHVFGCIQRAPQDSALIYLPVNKLLYMVDDSIDDSPEGLGLFRHIVKGADELTRYEQLEGFGFETDLRGIPLGRGPFMELEQMVKDGRLSKPERDAIIAPIQDFIQQHINNPQLGLLLDSMTYESQDESATPSAQPQWDMELLDGGAKSHAAADNAIRRKNREIARVLGVEHLLLGEGQRGSAALSQDKNRQFAMLIDGTLDETTETVERDIIRPLFVMNGWDQDLMPTPKTEAIQHREIEEVTGALRDMAQAGAILDPEDPVIPAVRELLGLPKPIIVRSADDAQLGPLEEETSDEDELPSEGSEEGEE